jgi:3-deoxy-D-manno-octulosonic-acid transferase
VLTGPQLFNFEEIARCLCAQGGAQVVQNADALAVQLTQWLADPALRQAIGAQGQRMVAENRGALQRVLQLVAAYL